jgi:hypothetical protein
MAMGSVGVAWWGGLGEGKDEEAARVGGGALRGRGGGAGRPGRRDGTEAVRPARPWEREAGGWGRT